MSSTRTHVRQQGSKHSRSAPAKSNHVGYIIDGPQIIHSNSAPSSVVHAGGFCLPLMRCSPRLGSRDRLAPSLALTRSSLACIFIAAVDPLVYDDDAGVGYARSSVPLLFARPARVRSTSAAALRSYSRHFPDSSIAGGNSSCDRGCFPARRSFSCARRPPEFVVGGAPLQAAAKPLAIASA